MKSSPLKYNPLKVDREVRSAAVQRAAAGGGEADAAEGVAAASRQWLRLLLPPR
jgi:hypothetical protein